jgi:hypothetical protein
LAQPPQPDPGSSQQAASKQASNPTQVAVIGQYYGELEDAFSAFKIGETRTRPADRERQAMKELIERAKRDNN